MIRRTSFRAVVSPNVFHDLLEDVDAQLVPYVFWLIEFAPDAVPPVFPTFLAAIVLVASVNLRSNRSYASN
eukprot:8768008-Heterocapsa_arctica.AAC.1